MGVDLGDVVPTEGRRLTDFKGKAIAIDAYNAIYQFLSIIRQPDGTPLKDREGRVTSHLAGLLYRTANLAEAGIKPVYVFDGKPSELKAATLAGRRERKEKAEADYAAAVAAGDRERAFSKSQQTARLTQDMVGQSKRLLDALGIPHVQAPGEGEAQAAHMAARGLVYASSSQDFDSLLFGAPRLVRNMTVTGRRKLPGKSVWVDVEPEMITLDAALAATGLTREQLVGVAILVGTDFNAGIKGIGPKKGVKALKDKGDVKRVLGDLGQEVPNLDAIIEIFLHPPVTDDVTLAWGKADERRVLGLLVGEHAFGEERVKAAVARYQALHEAGKQRSLDAFF
ncbi:MAG TPA: flap endonuclease-1 [Candidatus Thermoplasmatota archaeon]|nr:flap endonuclease-1 [Candidatus Thermoplasmatota archaeon]